MAEFLLELYSEEIPPNLQISARNQLKELITTSLEEKGMKISHIEVFSTPTRLSLIIKNLPEKIKILGQEIKGPKVGSSENILEGFTKAKNVSKKDLFEKETERGKFFFIKTNAKDIFVEDILTKPSPKFISFNKLEKINEMV